MQRDRSIDRCILASGAIWYSHLKISLLQSKGSLYTMTSDVIAFIQRMEAMYERLGHLYTQADLSVSSKSFLPTALKELSLAAEELQVATDVNQLCTVESS